MKTLIRLAVVAIAVTALCPSGKGQQYTVFDTKLNPPAPPTDGFMKTLDAVEPRIPITTNTTPGVASSTTYEIGRPGSYYLVENLEGSVSETGILVYASNVLIDLNGFSMIGSTNPVSGNNAPGIFVESNSYNVAIQNGSVTLWQDGIICEGENLTVRDLQVHHNSFDGLRAGDLTQVYDSTFEKNLSEGVLVGRNSMLENLLAATNNFGIVVGAGSVVRDCVSRDNVNYGIQPMGSGGRVESCLTYFNNIGIQISADHCTIVGNTCSSNKSYGISCGIIATTAYSHNTIDGNHLTRNGSTGIFVSGTDNLIVRNVAYDNQQFNYFIGASNQVGTVVSAIETNGVVGSSGGNLDSTVGPWSNFAR